MTREEALDRCKHLVIDTHFWSEDNQIALNMAIKALSQEPMREFTEEEAKAYSKALDKMYKPTGFNVFNEPCDDAISREAVFDAIEREDKWLLAAKGHNGLTEIAFSGLKARVDALPSVANGIPLEQIRAEIQAYADKLELCKASPSLEYILQIIDKDRSVGI